MAHFLEIALGGILIHLYQAIGLGSAEASKQVTAVSGALSWEVIVVVALILFFLLVRATLSVEKPNPAQQVAEMVHESIGGLGEQIIGHDYPRFQAFVTCIFLFVLLNNLLGLIPGISTPTGQPYVPLGLAALTFLYYNLHGIRVHGFKYIKQFLGPLPALAPLMCPIEIVSHLARVMSLTIRLYANMFASDLLMLVWFSIIPLAVPAAFLGLHFFVSIIQAFVFMLLTMIYLTMAVSEEH